jgi:hypothetical protein
MVSGNVQATKLQGRGGLFEKPIPVQKITAHDFVSTCTWDASRVLWKFVTKDSIDASTRQAYKTIDTNIWQLAKFLCCRKAVHNNFDTNENETSFVFVFCMHHKNWPKGVSIRVFCTSKFPSFQVLELIDSWFNLDFRVSGTHLSRPWTSKLTRFF